MKSADEIKKGLADPIHVHYHIADIEPRLTSLALHDLEFLHADALAYIQQIEADKKRAMENAEILSVAVSRLEKERDAAVADINIARPCRICKNKNDDYICSHCNIPGRDFEWRGVQKD